MGSSFISQLWNLIASPYGLVSITIGLLLVYQARRSRRLAWLLFTLCCFTASLAKYGSKWIKQTPPLVFPLEQLRDVGRPLAIILLSCILLLGFLTQNKWRRTLIPQPVKYLIFVQSVIFFKTLIYGDVGFAFLAAFTFGLVVLMVMQGPSRWLEDEQNFDLAVWSLAMVGVLFVIVNAYQALFDVYAITFVHGWFLGTTGNPIHAAVLLAATIPCFMFLIESRKQQGWIKAFWIVSLVLVMIALFLTASRTGTIMGVVSILFFYRNRAGTLLRFGIFVGLVLAVILPFLSQDVSHGGTSYSIATDKFLSGTNTREAVWLGLWNTFIDNPLFGTLLEGDRFVYGESSWLAAGANLGLLGFIPLVMFGFECLKMMFQLNKLSHIKPNYFLQSSTVIAGLASLLVGSLAEAFLLGNLTFSLLALLMYLSLGKYLIEINKIENATLCWYTLQN